MTLYRRGKSGIDQQSRTTFRHAVIETTTGGDLETDELITATATRFLDQASGYEYPDNLERGIINRINVMFSPVNAVTTHLYLLKGSHANDLTQRMWTLWNSELDYPAGLVKDVPYDLSPLKIPFILQDWNKIYYITDWQGVHGGVTGFIEVSGVVK